MFEIIREKPVGAYPCVTLNSLDILATPFLLFKPKTIPQLVKRVPVTQDWHILVFINHPSGFTSFLLLLFFFQSLHWNISVHLLLPDP